MKALEAADAARRREAQRAAERVAQRQQLEAQKAERAKRAHDAKVGVPLGLPDCFNPLGLWYNHVHLEDPLAGLTLQFRLACMGLIVRMDDEAGSTDCWFAGCCILNLVESNGGEPCRRSRRRGRRRRGAWRRRRWRSATRRRTPEGERYTQNLNLERALQGKAHQG